MPNPNRNSPWKRAAENRGVALSTAFRSSQPRVSPVSYEANGEVLSLLAVAITRTPKPPAACRSNADNLIIDANDLSRI